MKILIIADEVWNDSIHTNNVLSNWFEGFDAEFAEIYCSPGTPQNECCNKYFQITDTMMAKSILGGKKAGKELILGNNPQADPSQKAEQPNERLYLFLKSISTELLLVIRDFIWMKGKYNESELTRFINDVNPDIVFCPRLATPKLMRLEKMVAQISNKPMVAFTGDDEASFKQLRFSPIFWIRRFFINKMFKNTISIYSLYYMLSEQQAIDYSKLYKLKTKTLYKTGEFSQTSNNEKGSKTIKLVYAGKLYCNRWKTLVEIGRSLKTINREEIKMTLEIYTKDNISKKQRLLLNDNKNIFLRPPASKDELDTIYNAADIALHVESLDLKNKLLTRVSFSTKIIDLLACSCAVLAICWNKHAGYEYLKKEDAAICIDDYSKIQSVLKSLCDNPTIISEYAEKARLCGLRNHQKREIQKNLFTDFHEVITDFKKHQAIK